MYFYIKCSENGYDIVFSFDVLLIIVYSELFYNLLILYLCLFCKIIFVYNL